MRHSFGDVLPVPVGTVKRRLLLGLPPAACILLLFGMAAPLLLGGWSKWWCIPPGLGIGSYIASMALLDPQFFTAWIGEVRLKKRYY